MSDRIAKPKLPRLLVFLLLLLLPSPLCAYLDPGTGSMLFSALLGLISTLYFTLRGLFYTLRVRAAGLLGKNEGLAKMHHGLFFFSEGRQYWNVFSPILEELEKRGLSATFWTMDKEDPALQEAYQHIQVQYIGTGYAAFAQLNTLSADICTMTTPGLDVLQIKRSKKVKHYSHIIHALDDLSTYRVFGTDYFDSLLLSGDHQVDFLNKIEQLRKLPAKRKEIVGCTYLDVLAQRLAELQKTRTMQDTEIRETPRVLLAPSWGPNGLLRLYGLKLILPLAEAGFPLIIRPHPQSKASEVEMLSELQQQLSQFPNIEWDFERDNIHAFLKSDLMISDFSSVIYDYLILLKKPVFVSSFAFNHDGYDSSDLKDVQDPWVIRMSRELCHPLRDLDIPEIADIIAKLWQNPAQDAEQKLQSVCTSAYQYPGEAGKRAADFLISLHNELQGAESQTTPS